MPDPLVLSAVRERADNDAFNFWQPPWSRPDEEYTSGVRLSVDYAGPAWWSHVGSDGDCRGAVMRCSTRTFSLGQDVYTAERHLNEPTARPGSRPDAGWQRPIDWSRQLPFEPGLVASYDQRRYIALSGSNRDRGAELKPHAGASLGSILTEIVTIRSAVAEYQAGVSASWGRLGVVFVAHQDGPEYIARTTAHQWSTIELEWRLGR